jgi:hypothetical protein
VRGNAKEIRKSRAQNSICAPSTTTRLGGRRKKRAALSALRIIGRVAPSTVHKLLERGRGFDIVIVDV